MKKLLVALCTAIAVAGCQTTPNDASTVSGLPQHSLIRKVVQPQNQTIVYFDADWKPSKKPAAGGFYRKLYGKTKQGHYIAQDFYQDTQTKQVDPFEVIDEAGLTVSDNSHSTGDVVWYTPAGKKKLAQRFDRGRDTGNTTIYHPNKAVGVRVRPLNNLKLKQPHPYPHYTTEVYAPDGTQQAYILWYGREPAHVEFYGAGKKMLSIKQADISTHKNGRGEPFTVWVNKDKGSKANQRRAIRLVEHLRLLLPESIK